MAHNLTEIHRIAAIVASQNDHLLPIFERMEEIMAEHEAIKSKDAVQIARMKLMKLKAAA
ncbi:hypothetical protein [Roseicitreum antarcticum]|uniref:hypothetical protein n=1 Tax=Roseicitreum antarcticum TaxID=564137 RepID=UPI001680388D|nr:hypothetical protein [Roseicitreum antarcticum]